MQPLLETTFTAGAFPDDWEISRDKTEAVPDGVKVMDRFGFQFQLPCAGGESVRVELEIDTAGPVFIECGNADIVIALNVCGFKYPRHTITKNFMHLLGESRTLATEKRGPQVVAFTFSRERLVGAVDREELIVATDPYPRSTGRVIHAILHGTMVVKSLRVFSAAEIRAGMGERRSGAPSGHRAAPNSAGPADFFLEQNVDFPGFMSEAAFTHRTFDKLMAEFASWGVQRVHWFHYGRREDGWWDHATGNAGLNAAKTFDSVGDIMTVAVKAAHAQGMEIFGVLKPFDMGLPLSYGEDTPEAKARGRVNRIGGPVGFITRFAAQHRELAIQRKPGTAGPPIHEMVSRIDLVKEDDGPSEISINDLKLYVSDDNDAYRLYDGAIHRSELIEEYPRYQQTASGPRPTHQKHRTRVLRLTQLQIRSPYIAIAVDGRAGSFTNTLLDLIHVYGERGEEPRITYGITPRPHDGESGKRFIPNGIEFDYTGGTPSACFAGYNRTEWPLTLDGGHGLVVIGRGKDEGALAALSPAFEETRRDWLSWVQQILDAGADGVEIRMRNHHDHFAWTELGFEQPVRDEFLKRHGVDIWTTDDFDWAALRRLRGEYYTQFLRDTKALVKQYGKKLGLHVSISQDMEPEQGAAMEIYWDWRRWIEEGLADSITMKEVSPGTRFSEEILAMTRPRGIPVIFCPYNHNLSPSSLSVQFRNAREAGYAGFQKYTPIVRGTADESIRYLSREEAEILRAHFARR